MTNAEDGAQDYLLGLEPKFGQCQDYYAGYYDLKEQNGVAGWMRGEQLADKGESLPDTATKDCKRGYYFRRDLNQMRAE